MSLTLENVQHVAHLARLNLNNPDRARAELDQIMNLMAQLATVDTSAVMPLAHPLEMMDLAMAPWRADEAITVTTQDAAQLNAPAQERGLYLVPRVVE